MSIYWIDVQQVRLGIMARPRGDDWLVDDLRAPKRSGVDVIVSALTAPETEELGLTEEAEGCVQNGITFFSFPIEDRSVPANFGQFEIFVSQLLEHARNGKSLVIHCRAGIGRSSLIAGCALTKLGLSADQAFRFIEKARSCPVPDTLEQWEWVENYWASGSELRE